ncbi:caspase-8-like [Daphnia carinata]|uniref:caspase-8-like n=1 Tax=Daphnia carinata TaxID=120202 RepID=UPI00257B1929|nr:caspase-8-like [Daphnia carinata]
MRSSIYSVYKEDHKFVLNDQNEDLAKLIKSMLKFEESARPTLQEVLDNPYYNPSNDDDVYALDDYKIPGLCVIFNQQVFQDKKQNRGGSDKDRDALQKTFKKLGFETRVFENVASFDLESEIKNLAKRDWEDYGCLVVCLLSHGVENAIMCYDGKFANINELKYEFSLNNCPSLYRKPKIFIVQACQVPLNDNDLFSHICNTISFAFGRWQSPSTVKWPKKKINATHEIKMIQDARKNPPLMDFITIKAALAGFEAYQIKEIKKTFEEY